MRSTHSARILNLPDAPIARFGRLAARQYIGGTDKHLAFDLRIDFQAPIWLSGSTQKIGKAMSQAARRTSAEFRSIVAMADALHTADRLRRGGAGKPDSDAQISSARSLFQSRLIRLLEQAEEAACQHDAFLAGQGASAYSLLDTIDDAKCFELAMGRCLVIWNPPRAEALQAGFIRRMLACLDLAELLASKMEGSENHA